VNDPGATQVETIDALRAELELALEQVKESNEAYDQIVEENEALKVEVEDLRRAISVHADSLIDQIKDFDKRNGR
jgi:regulator of replication initiation timing